MQNKIYEKVHHLMLTGKQAETTPNHPSFKVKKKIKQENDDSMSTEDEDDVSFTFNSTVTNVKGSNSFNSQLLSMETNCSHSHVYFKEIQEPDIKEDLKIYPGEEHDGDLFEDTKIEIVENIFGKEYDDLNILEERIKIEECLQNRNKQKKLVVLIDRLPFIKQHEKDFNSLLYNERPIGDGLPSMTKTDISNRKSTNLRSLPLKENCSNISSSDDLNTNVLKSEIKESAAEEVPEDYPDNVHDDDFVEDNVIEIVWNSSKEEYEELILFEKEKTRNKEYQQNRSNKLKQLVVLIEKLPINKLQERYASLLCTDRNLNNLKGDNMLNNSLQDARQISIRCQECNKTFSSQLSLEFHIMTEHSDKENMTDIVTRKYYSCNTCKFKTMTKGKFIIHLQRHKCVEGQDTNNKYSCDICGFKSIHLRGLSVHNLVHTGKLTSFCTLCNINFTTRSHWQRHVVAKHPEDEQMMNNVTSKIYSCDICEYKTLLRSYIEVHMQVHKGLKQDKTYQCDICEFKTIHRSSLNSHKLLHTRNFAFACLKCDKKFNTQRQLDAHIVTKHSDDKELFNSIKRKIFYCDTCKYKTVYRRCFELHLRWHKGVKMDKMYQCDICDFKTIAKQYLRTHIELHSGTLSFPCLKCEKKFNRKRNLYHHIIARHSDDEEMMNSISYKLYSCDMCEFKTIAKSSFKIHLLIHEGREENKNYQCDICKFKTYYKGGLRNHIKTHLKDQQFVCINCKRKYSTKGCLDRHIVTKHSNNQKLMDTVTCKVYICDVCDYKTASKKDFSEHNQKHEGVVAENYYQCDICGFKTLYKHGIRKHVQTHSRNHNLHLPFSCKKCKRKFSRELELFTHILVKHLDDEQMLNSVTYKIYSCDICKYKTLGRGNLYKHKKRNH